MEFVDGQPLSALLRQGAGMPPAVVVPLLAQAADAIGAAHAAGIVHRDVKPANLLVTPDRTIKITDFGIARAAEGVALTQTGQVMGTPQYLAPEQAEGREAVPASDVYSLACVAYECLAGRRPSPASRRSRSRWPTCASPCRSCPTTCRPTSPPWCAAASRRTRPSGTPTATSSPVRCATPREPPPRPPRGGPRSPTAPPRCCPPWRRAAGLAAGAGAVAGGAAAAMSRPAPTPTSAVTTTTREGGAEPEDRRRKGVPAGCPPPCSWWPRCSASCSSRWSSAVATTTSDGRPDADGDHHRADGPSPPPRRRPRTRSRRRAGAHPDPTPTPTPTPTRRRPRRRRPPPPRSRPDRAHRAGRAAGAGRGRPRAALAAHRAGRGRPR